MAKRLINSAGPVDNDDTFNWVQDVDSKRQEIGLNVKQWVAMAHGSLDPNNEGDQVMLLRISGYVNRVLKDHPFLLVSNAGADERDEAWIWQRLHCLVNPTIEDVAATAAADQY